MGFGFGSGGGGRGSGGGDAGISPVVGGHIILLARARLWGPGTGEHVARPEEYAELAAVRDWRKVLSNFHVCPFRYKEFRYNTIEHAFQAEKIRLVSPLSAFLFTMDSVSDLSRGDGLVAQKQRKMVVLPLAELARWNATSTRVMADIARAKYAQCAAARRVLLATRRAQLWHVQMRKKAVRFAHLEDIRRDLARQNY